jgi:hypothetical protein
MDEHARRNFPANALMHLRLSATGVASWFQPRASGGIGAPVTWQGWVLTSVLIAVFVGVTAWLA